MNELPFLADLIPPPESIWRLLMAAVVGAVLGWNRERSGKPAGLRTHMLVSLGAATFMVAGVDYIAELGPSEKDWLRMDPLRIVYGIIGGVGFLGAGSIIESRGSVRGLTTAATIWVSAAAGTACGLGLYGVAGTSVLLAVLVLSFVGVIERTFFGDPPDDS